MIPPPPGDELNRPATYWSLSALHRVKTTSREPHILHTADFSLFKDTWSRKPKVLTRVLARIEIETFTSPVTCHKIHNLCVWQGVSFCHNITFYWLLPIRNISEQWMCLVEMSFCGSLRGFHTQGRQSVQGATWDSQTKGFGAQTDTPLWLWCCRRHPLALAHVQCRSRDYFESNSFRLGLQFRCIHIDAAND